MPNSPPNSTAGRFPSYPLLSFLLYSLLIFYLTWCILPIFPLFFFGFSFYIFPRLPCHFYLVVIEEQLRAPLKCLTVVWGGSWIRAHYAERRKPPWRLYSWSLRNFYTHAQRNLFEIKLNQTEIILYLPLFVSFWTKRTSVLFQVTRKMVNTIWFRRDLIRFGKYFSACRTFEGSCVWQLHPWQQLNAKRIDFRSIMQIFLLCHLEICLWFQNVSCLYTETKYFSVYSIIERFFKFWYNASSS